MSSDKKISIIIPFYNAEKYIESCVRSLQNQSYSNFEAIFVDDGSTDASVELLREYMDERFVILRQPNSGVSSARNRGLNFASGDYLAFMDIDDELENDYLHHLLQAMVTNNVPIVLCNYLEIYGDGTIVENCLPWSNSLLTKTEIQNELLPRMISDENGIVITGSVWRTFVDKSYWENKTIYFDKDIRIAEDLLFLIQLYGSVDRIYILSECLYKYHKNANSALNKYYEDGTQKNLDFHKRFVRLLKEEGLFQHNSNGYYKNKVHMYTAAISNLARAPRVFCNSNFRDLHILREELANEPFDWNNFDISKGRKVSLWMLENKMDIVLLFLYRIKEFIRLRRFRKQ